MYENMYEAYTPYEAERLLRSNPKEFNRLYSNMRRALQRRAKALEKHDRQYTEGYKKIKTALKTADGKDRAQSFSLISSTAVAKNTKYSWQIEHEKEFMKNMKKKGLLKGNMNKKETRTFFKLLDAAYATKSGKLFYKKDKEAMWQKIESLAQEKNADYKFLASQLFTFLEE